jgi:hypothetical protein
LRFLLCCVGYSMREFFIFFLWFIGQCFLNHVRYVILNGTVTERQEWRLLSFKVFALHWRDREILQKISVSVCGPQDQESNPDPAEWEANHSTHVWCCIFLSVHSLNVEKNTKKLDSVANVASTLLTSCFCEIYCAYPVLLQSQTQFIQDPF